MNRRRFAAFVVVGVVGFAVQMSTFAALVAFAGWSYLPATGVAVEAAVLHNFAWHERWIWADRQSRGTIRARLLRFNATTGLTSIGGNVIVVAALVQGFNVPPFAANIIAVGLLTGVNFLVADSWVFAASLG
jgi:putative flippase GtrA